MRVAAGGASSGLASEPRTGRLIERLPLYLAFAGTGVGLALPGALLPIMLHRLGFSDEQGGRLFLLSFLGSSLGALLVRGSLRTALLLGGSFIAAGAMGLGSFGGVEAYLSMSLLGTGLGLTMTSISLVRQRQSAGSGTEMVRLNLLWAMGAVACPSLTVRVLTSGDLRPLLDGFACCFVLFVAWVAFQPDWPMGTSSAPVQRPWQVFCSVPAGLIVMTFLITGIEASAGGWLATYARRGDHAVAETIGAPTCFWAGLLLSRLVWSVIDQRIAHDRTVRFSIALMTAAAALLVVGGGGPLLLMAAFLMGFGVGPTYPLLLGWALHFQSGGAIFVIAGVGSAALPWLTGLVSARQSSLRLGLVVPMLGAVTMLTLALLLPLKRWSEQESAD